jgi:hypothetical protein
LFLALCAWAVTAACSSGGGGSLHDASISDGDGAVLDLLSFDFSFGDLPPDCPPGVANDKGIGAVCTMGGHECPSSNSDSNPLICTCDTTAGVVPPPGTPCFCTVPIFFPCDDSTHVPSDVCGQNATCCSYQEMVSICVPDTCLDAMMCPTP